MASLLTSLVGKLNLFFGAQLLGWSPLILSLLLVEFIAFSWTVVWLSLLILTPLCFKSFKELTAESLLMSSLTSEFNVLLAMGFNSLIGWETSGVFLKACFKLFKEPFPLLTRSLGAITGLLLLALSISESFPELPCILALSTLWVFWTFPRFNSWHVVATSFSESFESSEHSLVFSPSFSSLFSSSFSVASRGSFCISLSVSSQPVSLCSRSSLYPDGSIFSVFIPLSALSGNSTGDLESLTLSEAALPASLFVLGSSLFSKSSLVSALFISTTFSSSGDSFSSVVMFCSSWMSLGSSVFSSPVVMFCSSWMSLGSSVFSSPVVMFCSSWMSLGSSVSSPVVVFRGSWMSLISFLLSFANPEVSIASLQELGTLFLFSQLFSSTFKPVTAFSSRLRLFMASSRTSTSSPGDFSTSLPSIAVSSSCSSLSSLVLFPLLDVLLLWCCFFFSWKEQNVKKRIWWKGTFPF